MIYAFRFLFRVIKKKKRKRMGKADDILISSFQQTALFFAELGFSDRRIGLFMSMTL